jgi:uncharacterized protein YkwD
MPSMPIPPLLRLVLAMLTSMLVLSLVRPADTAGGVSRAERKLQIAINLARRAYGLRPLRIGWRIEIGARRWARYLRVRGTFFHARVGVSVSENLGWVTCRRRWARTLVRWWLTSSGHRWALLDRRARYVGVGVSTGGWRRFSCVRMTVTRFR